MTKLSVRAKLLHMGATYPLAGWLRPSVLIISGALAAALIGATLSTPLSGSIGEAVTAQAFVDSPRPEAVPAVEVMKIVPTDALEKNLFWSPATGDGSN